MLHQTTVVDGAGEYLLLRTFSVGLLLLVGGLNRPPATFRDISYTANEIALPEEAGSPGNAVTPTAD